MSLFGCSSSIFTGDKAGELDSLKGDGRFNKLCLGLNLSKPDLDVGTTRALVKCLNSNGSIQEYADLVAKLSDKQLGIVVDTLNAEIMTNPQRLRELDQSFRQLDKSDTKILDRGLKKISKALAKTKFIRAAIKLLRQGTSTNGGSTELDPSVMASIRIMAQELEDNKSGADGEAAARQNLSRALETAVAMTALQSYKATTTGLRSAIPSLPGNKLEDLIRNGHKYLKAKIESKDHPYGKLLLWGIADGTLFDAFDYYYHNECENVSPDECHSSDMFPNDPDRRVHAQVQAMEDFIKVLTVDPDDAHSNRTRILKPMINLFNRMDNPISCMDGTKEVPNGDLFVMTEIAGLAPRDVPQWLTRTNLMKIKLANGMCDFENIGQKESKETFNQLIAVLRTLAAYGMDSDGDVTKPGFGRPLVTVAHFLKGLETGDHATNFVDGEWEDLCHFMRASDARVFAKGVPVACPTKPDPVNGKDPRYRFNERYRRFLVHWLGDKGPYNSYDMLTDGLAEISHRGVLGNTLYLLDAAAPNRSDGTRPVISRVDLQKVMRILLKKRMDLKTNDPDVPGTDPKNWRSLYDVFTNALRTVDEDTLVTFAQGISDFVDDADDYTKPLLDVSREGLLANDKNPIVNIALHVATNAETAKNKILFNTLFDITDTTEFERAMLLTAKMADNGTLKELLDGILTIFKGTINSAPGNATPQAIPPQHLCDADRDRSTLNRPAWNPDPAWWPVNGASACNAINLSVPMGEPYPGSDHGAEAWKDQMTQVAACVNANGNNAEVQQLMDYANNAPMTGRSARQNSTKTFMGYLVELVADLIPSEEPGRKDVYQELGDALLQNSEDFKAMNGMLPLLFGKKYCVQYNADDDDDHPRYNCPANVEEVSVMQAIGRTSMSLTSKSAQLDNVLGAGKKIVEDLNVPRAGIWALDTLDLSKNDPVPADVKPPLVSYPLSNYSPNGSNTMLPKMLDDAIRRFEKREPTDAIRKEKYEAYWREPIGNAQKRYTDYAGRERIGFKDADDMKRVIKPFLDELSVDYRLEWALAFFFYMDHNPYWPEWWSSWFRRAANNVRPVAWYYPGSFPSKNNPPVVRLVSQLDLLDLVVIAADFSLNSIGQPLGFLFGNPDDNFSIKYLSAIAQSGRSITPAVDAMQKELTFFTSLMNDPLLGAALKPETKRRLFNLSQVFSILREFDTEYEWYDPVKKQKVYLNDLGVLRDLFKAVLSATNKSDWNNYKRDKNSLSVITELVEVGILRNVGVNMWYRNPNKGDLRHSVNGDDTDPNNRYVVPNEVSNILRFLINSTIFTDGGTRKLNADTKALVTFLMREDCDTSLPKYQTAAGCRLPRSEWAKENFNERYVFIGKMIDQFFKWTKDDDYNEDHRLPRVMTNIKRGAYDMISLVERLGSDSASTKLPSQFAGRLVSALRPLLGTKKGTQLILDNIDLVEPLLKKTKGIHFAEKIIAGENDNADGINFEALRDVTHVAVNALADNGAIAADSGVDLVSVLANCPNATAAKNSIKWMIKDPEYLTLKENPAFDTFKRWLLRDDTKLRPRLHQYLGTHTGNGDVRDLVLFMGRESSGDRLYKNLEFLGKNHMEDSGGGPVKHYDYIEKLNWFMDLLKRGIAEPEPLR